MNGTVCEQCPDNTYSDNGASVCTDCTDGKVSAAGSTSADDCYYGTNIVTIINYHWFFNIIEPISWNAVIFSI